MNAFLVSLLFGAFEMVLLFLVMWTVNNSKRALMRLLLLVKFLTYAFAIGILLNRYSQYIVFCMCGFLVGLPMCALVLYIIKIYFSEKAIKLFNIIISKIKRRNVTMHKSGENGQ